MHAMKFTSSSASVLCWLIVVTSACTSTPASSDRHDTDQFYFHGACCCGPGYGTPSRVFEDGDGNLSCDPEVVGATLHYGSDCTDWRSHSLCWENFPVPDSGVNLGDEQDGGGAPYDTGLDHYNDACCCGPGSGIVSHVFIDDAGNLSCDPETAANLYHGSACTDWESGSECWEQSPPGFSDGGVDAGDAGN